LAPGPFICPRENIEIVGKRTFQQMRLTIKGKVCSMKEVHLQMELAVPAIAGKTSLWWRRIPAALDGKQIA
jgi:hypothetical protein